MYNGNPQCKGSSGPPPVSPASQELVVMAPPGHGPIQDPTAGALLAMIKAGFADMHARFADLRACMRAGMDDFKHGLSSVSEESGQIPALAEEMVTGPGPEKGGVPTSDTLVEFKKGGVPTSDTLVEFKKGCVPTSDTLVEFKKGGVPTSDTLVEFKKGGVLDINLHYDPDVMERPSASFIKPDDPDDRYVLDPDMTLDYPNVPHYERHIIQRQPESRHQDHSTVTSLPVRVSSRATEGVKPPRYAAALIS